MRALQRINSMCFLAGYLGFLATFLLDTIYQLLHKPGVKATADAVEAVLRALSPHYNLARCLIWHSSSSWSLSPWPSTWSSQLPLH